MRKRSIASTNDAAYAAVDAAIELISDESLRSLADYFDATANEMQIKAQESVPPKKPGRPNPNREAQSQHREKVLIALARADMLRNVAYALRRTLIQSR